MLNNTKVTQNSDGTIEIISAAGIDMKNVVIDQDVCVSIAAQAIQSSAIDMGLQTATEMTVDAASSSQTDSDIAGLNDLAKELADGNTNAISKIMEGGWGNMNNLFIVGGVVIHLIINLVFYLIILLIMNTKLLVVFVVQNVLQLIIISVSINTKNDFNIIY